MLITAGLRPRGEEGKNMRLRILWFTWVVVVLSVCVASATAAPKPKLDGTSQQKCESYGGTFSTKANSSFFRPFFKKQGVVWTCNSYSGGSTATQDLVQSCMSDGGKATSTSDAGFATCWLNPPL
jgi:uncharacterized membrane protein